MSFNDVLAEIIEGLGISEGVYIVNWHTIQRWPDGVLKALNNIKLLSKTKQAESIECLKCENHCYQDVHFLPHKDKPTRAFIVCDDPDMQGQMGRIQIPIEQLQQWKTTPLHFARVVAKLLDIECKADYKHGQINIRIGMLSTKKGRRWLSLNVTPLTLEINQHPAPLDEVLFFEGDRLAIDHHRITLLAEDSRQGTAKNYTPNIEQREAGKRKTEAMYEDWQAEYLRLSKMHPDKPDTWISKKIAKLDIAKGRDSETIRKNMKP